MARAWSSRFVPPAAVMRPRAGTLPVSSHCWVGWCQWMEGPLMGLSDRVELKCHPMGKLVERYSLGP